MPSALVSLDIDLSATPTTGTALQDATSALRQDVSGAVDGPAAAMPLALCGVAIVYANFPAAYLSLGVFASLLGLALIHLIRATGGRPMVFSARLFEGTTLSSMLGQFFKLAPGWGLTPTPQCCWPSCVCWGL